MFDFKNFIPCFSKIIFVILPTVFILNACTVDEISIPPIDLSAIIPKSESKPEVSVFDTYRPGELLHCKIGIGAIKLGSDWLDFKEKSFVIIKNGRSNVNLKTKKYNKRASIQAIFDDPGQKIMICPLFSDPKKVVDCMSLYFVDKDLEYGIKRSVNIKGFMQAGVVSCAYKESDLKTLHNPN